MAFPSFGSCEEIETIVAPYIQGLVLDEDIAYIDDEQISCQWHHDDGAVTSFDQIQIFGLDIEVGDDEVLTMEEVEAVGMEEIYFTDPRLEELGGIGVWLDGDNAVLGAGSGSVLLPGLEISLTDGRVGAQNLMDREAMVELALRLADG